MKRIFSYTSYENILISFVDEMAQWVSQMLLIATFYQIPMLPYSWPYMQFTFELVIVVRDSSKANNTVVCKIYVTFELLL